MGTERVAELRCAEKNAEWSKFVADDLPNHNLPKNFFLVQRFAHFLYS